MKIAVSKPELPRKLPDVHGTLYSGVENEGFGDGKVARVSGVETDNTNKENKSRIEVMRDILV